MYDMEKCGIIKCGTKEAILRVGGDQRCRPIVRYDQLDKQTLNPKP